MNQRLSPDTSPYDPRQNIDLSVVNFTGNVECTARPDCIRPGVIRAKSTCKNELERISFYCSEHYNWLREGKAACAPCRFRSLTVHMRLWLMDL